MTLTPGRAKLIKAGSDIIFQTHYTTNGHAGKDRTSVGITVVDAATVKERIPRSCNCSRTCIALSTPMGPSGRCCAFRTTALAGS